MIDRRQTLWAIIRGAAAGVACCHGIGFGNSPISCRADSNDPPNPLEESLRTVIEIFCEQPDTTEFLNLFEAARLRVHRVPDDAPAFWQSCTDAACRLEIQFAAEKNPKLFRVASSEHALYQLRSLRKHLADRTVQAIGGRQSD